MVQIRVLYIVFSVILLVVSCKESSKKELKEGTKELTIEMDKIQSAYAFSEYELIPLELNDLSLVGSIDKMIVEKDKIFILDKKITKTLFCFSAAGKFLFKVNPLGEGPGEFLNPADFNLRNKTVHILDVMQKKTIVFDLEGNFRYEEKFPFDDQVVNFYPINQNLTAYHMDGRSYGSDETDLIKVFNNKDATFSIQGVKDIGSTDAFQIPIEFSGQDGNVRFLHAWTDTIYKISENEIEAEYILNFGADRLDKRLKKLPLLDMRQYIMENPYVFNAANLVENQAYLSFHWTRSKQGFANSEEQKYVSYYRKRTGTLVHFPLLENWLEKVSLEGPLYGTDEYFYGYVAYEDWMKLPEGKRNNLIKQKPEVSSEFLNAGNPIIVKYRLNEE